MKSNKNLELKTILYDIKILPQGLAKNNLKTARK